MSLQEVFIAAQQLLAIKYALCAGVTVLFYDHLITFGEEVEHVWKKMNGFVSYLFLLNRYYTPVALIIIMIAFFSPLWPRETCQKFVLFQPLGVAVPLFVISGALLIMRVYAIYGRNVWVLIYLSLFQVVLIAVAIWEYTTPGWGVVPFPGNIGIFQGCFYSPSPDLGYKVAALLAIEIMFDISVFALIVFRTWTLFKHSKRTALFQKILQDGALYFGVIVTTNVAWKLMVLFAPVGIKELLAHPVLILICTMINRLTLSLRVDSGIVKSPQTSDMFPRSVIHVETFPMGRVEGRKRF